MRDQSGYTLTETIVVLAIVALITSVGLPYITPRQTMLDARAMAQLLETTALNARAEAIVKQRTVRLVLTLEEPRTLKRDDEIVAETLPASLQIQTRSGKNLTQDQQTASYVFYPNGTSTGGRIVVSDKNSREEVRIHWLTATVERLPLATTQ
jgi:general secretion pathway protein H